MSEAGSVGIIGGVAVLIVLAVMVWLFRGRKASLTGNPPEAKPEWMRTAPPKETVAALKADGDKFAVYDHDKGEKLASPFAEQIEDIVRAKMKADPALKSVEIDFGTAPDGGVEIILGEKAYTDIEQIPDERVKTIIKQSIHDYNQRK